MKPRAIRKNPPNMARSRGELDTNSELNIVLLHKYFHYYKKFERGVPRGPSRGAGQDARKGVTQAALDLPGGGDDRRGERKMVQNCAGSRRLSAGPTP